MQRRMRRAMHVVSRELIRSVCNCYLNRELARRRELSRVFRTDILAEGNAMTLHQHWEFPFGTRRHMNVVLGQKKKKKISWKSMFAH